jgi:serine/threonine protein kinase
VIVDDSVGLPPNLGSISNLRLNPDDYEFKFEIGGSPFGAMWKGIDKRTGAAVGLKTLHSPLGETDIYFHRRLLIGHSLSHPSILPLYGYLPACPATNGHVTIVRPFMVNELCPCSWLDQTAKVKMLIGVASGIAFMHDRNIIHRNLRPESILLDERYEPKISGLGFLKAIPTPEGLYNSKGGHRTGSGAPESLAGDIVGVKADVHSFGMIMYFIVGGGWPSTGLGSLHAVSVGSKKLMRQGLRPEFPSETPRAFVELTRKCWAAKPDSRPTSREVLQTLCSRELLQSIPDLDLTILREFASRTVPLELRGFLGQNVPPL